MNTPASVLRRVAFHPIAVALVASVALLAVGEAVRPGFTSGTQFVNLLRIAAFLGFIAAGQTLVIISGNDGIDLSVGSVVTTSAIIVYALNGTLGLPLAVMAAIGAGALVGAFNGIGITLVRLPPLIMTLGTAGVVNGIVLVATGGRPTGSENVALTAFVTQPWILGVPGTVILWLFLALVLHVVLTRMTWGKALYAIGANAEAARLAGIRTDVGRVAIYVASGALAAIGGVVLLGYTGTVFINLGEPYTLPSVAAVVVGGTLMAGGVGSYWGTVVGAILLTILQSFLIAIGLPEYLRQVIYGALVAVVLSLYARR